uniref:Integrase catalytic domain-containing protein n=1 Tax=Cacopsylla melanoneura TaxID=428564 RepID=A0A8D8TQ66_9HEMI
MPSVQDQIALAVLNRNNHFESMQRCFDASKDATKAITFKVRAARIEETFRKFEETIATIQALNLKADAADQVDCSQTIVAGEDLYYNIKAHMSSLNEHNQAPPVVTGAATVQNPQPKIRLPTLSVPLFNGDVASFPPWRSLYEQLIHNNQDLSDIEKFSYLKSYVQDSAAHCIEHIPFVAANYPLAYQSLLTRFSKKRILANAYLAKVLTFQPLLSDNVKLLRNFLDIFHVNVESIKGLKIQDLGEFILLQLGLRALDDKTRLEFETSNVQVNFPTFNSLVKFVQKKCAILELTNDQSASNNKSRVVTNHLTSTSTSSPSSRNKTSTRSLPSFTCSVCNSGEHRIASCPKFLRMDTPQRYNQVKALKLCFACLSSTHAKSECHSTYQCRVCRSTNHHSLLHSPETGTTASVGASTSRGSNTAGRQHQPTSSFAGLLPTSSPCVANTKPGNLSIQSQPTHQVLLGTATIEIQDAFGQWNTIQCLIDAGSQISVISHRLAQLLKLPIQSSRIEVSGVGADQPLRAKGELVCHVRPHPDTNKVLSQPISLRVVILPKIAGDLSPRVSPEVLNQFGNLQLADLSYKNPYRGNLNIDLLIGAEYYGQLMDLSSSMIVGSPSAVPTVFGWLLIGRAAVESSSEKCHSFFITEDPLATQLQKFWETEEVPNYQPQDPEALACEEHFLQTHERDPSGKYIVRLPFKGMTPPDLGSNRVMAVKRLNSLDKRLSRNLEYKQMYDDNLKSYLNPGHMTVAETPSDYLLVHHGVYKATSTTTKLRVVFDPNIPSNSGLNLANSLMVGPKLQKDISDLLVHFRLKCVAMTCDIESMYRCIDIHKDDRTYQHILWHEPNDPQNITEFELTTVTFGLPPSPFQAQRVLQQLAIDEGEQFPEAAEVLRNYVYVDDLIMGASSVEEALELRNQIISLLSKGGFKVRKWASSHPAVLKDMAEELCEKPHLFLEGGEEAIKVLGIQWCPAMDSFFYVVNEESSLSTLSKRQVLSFVARIYDCNGYLSPVTIWIKIFLQQLWLQNDLSWDTPLSQSMTNQWNSFANQVSVLRNIKIPRYIESDHAKSCSLVGFADASVAAYACVVYLRICYQNGEVKTYLIRAKSRVASLKVQTINRLELNAAMLLVKVIKSLDFLSKRLCIDQIYLFSDSAVVLSWLRTPPYRLKIYVANRVTQILESTEPKQWRHVTSEKNPADPASRGLMPNQLINNGLWFRGPSFLKQPPEAWPKPLTSVEQSVPELKPSSSFLIQTEENNLINVIEKFSSLSKLKRVMGLVLKFIDKCRKGISSKGSGNLILSLTDLSKALLVVIKVTQHHHMGEELKQVKSGQVCANLRNLSPILNSSGLLAVGGRLANAPIPESAKHPILIPGKSHLATLLVNYYHAITLHGGPKLVQSLLQQHYWILGARNLIRGIIFKCIDCFKRKPVFRQPMMADLPLSRYSQGRPFLNVGIDYAGPFTYKTGPRRNSPLAKCWFALFICMSTKCIHLELVSELTTQAFLASLDRFVGRRGLPTTIFSDNGTNFLGASNYLSDVQAFLRSADAEIDQFLQIKEVRWNFIPPSAPNFGGLWEAGVRSVKKHLSHVLQGQSWTFEEISTFLIRIEAILNSRPICPLSSSPNDGVNYLTPGHFLIGGPLVARPEIDMREEPMSHLRRWQLITQVVQCFWTRWSKDYLQTLISRSKWTKPSEKLKVGDVVLVQGSTLPSQKWPLGVVTKVLPGPNNEGRVVCVRTAHGELVRPASKLAVLPV